jgi:peptidoglycan/xylan/chitin deacetylase (PgdA/CDA1 family)
VVGGKAPPYGVQASPKAGTIDHSGIAWGSYGGKVGVWRILALLDRHGIRGTFCVNARCAEIFPDAVAAIVEHAHDVAGHGYLQDELLTALEPADEQATIRRSLDILRRATGRDPSGWISPVTAFTAHTRKFLAAEKLIWHGDARDTDLPSLVVQKPVRSCRSGRDFTDNRDRSARRTSGMSTRKLDYLRARVAGLSGAVDALPFRRPADDHGGV